MSSTEGATLPILHLDEHLCAVLKPASMPAQPDRTGDPSALELLRAQLNDPGIELVHRLDRPVSGVLLFARDRESLRTLNNVFQQRGVEKTYVAIVEGVWEKGQVVLENNLAHDARSHKARVTVEGKGALARMEVRVLAKGERLSLLELRPEGGAFHQIRAQLAAAGHPIRGDVKYGARRGEKDRSIALHARSLAFHHPVDDQRVELVAPFRSDGVWVSLLKLADQGDAG